MLLALDVEDDLLEMLPKYYRRENFDLIYQNGKDNPEYVVTIKVYPL